jgi:UDP-2-acetamido-2,6-beta-L-arabino-hexul-4-ose reductase
LYNYFGLFEDVERVPFQDDFFLDNTKLQEFVRKCDVIVHLAGVNRLHDQNSLYDTNVTLVRQVIDAMIACDHKPHVIFASSTQEERDNPYGKSKKDGRKLFIEWAEKNGAPFTGMVIPNVFGPFGMPFYNSVIATFSHQLVNRIEPKIEIDADLSLIYINDLVSEIREIINNRLNKPEYQVKEKAIVKVSNILGKLKYYQKNYLNDGIIPDLGEYFDLCLFNTFRSYLPVDFFPKTYPSHPDDRGNFVELVKTPNGGQTSFSKTRSSMIRGNHFHIRKVERFMVIKGDAKMRLRRIGTDKVIEYSISGDKPSFVDVPIWFTHNITNTGKKDLYTVFWINELYNPADPDTYYQNVKE